MEYKKAAQIRKKGLLELIAENKFSKEKSIGASIGGAISDKMKAKAVGIKEKFDPLNMVKALTGDGFIGKSIRTVAGRAMGRSEEHIRHFGGYGSRKRKLKETKDPLFTTIGSGAIVKIKSGDSISNILAKMYSFMEKTYETRRLNTELEDAFRKEQLDEDERRHKKLIESILNKKPTAVPEDDGDKEKSFIEKLLDGIKSAFSFALSPILAAIAFLKSGLSNLGNLAKSAAKLLLGPVLEVLRPLLSGIFTALIRSILSPKVIALLVGLAVAEYFKFEKISEKTNTSSMQQSAKNLPGKINPGDTESKGEPFKLSAENLLNYKKDTVEKIHSGELATYHVTLPGTNQSQFLALNKEEAQELKIKYNRLASIPREIEALQSKSDPESVERLRTLRDMETNTQKEIDQIWQKNLSGRFQKPDDALVSFIDNRIKYPDKGRFGGKLAAIGDDFNAALSNFGDKLKSDPISPSLPEVPAEPPKATNDAKTIPESAPTKNIPDMLPDNFGVDEGEWNKPGTLNVYGNNSQNTIGGGPAKMVDGSPTPVRNLEKTLQKHFRPAVV